MLERARHDHQPEFNAYDIAFDDGSHVELFAGGLDGGGEPFSGGYGAWRAYRDHVVRTSNRRPASEHDKTPD